MAKKVAVIGAGVMGPGIAQAFASSGFETTLIDKRPKALATALGRIRDNLGTLVELKVMGAGDAKSTLRRIATTTRLCRRGCGSRLYPGDHPGGSSIEEKSLRDFG